MKRIETVGAALVMGVLLAALSGCEKQEGPAERAGKEIDQTMEQLGEKTDEAVEQAGEQLEQAGDSIQEAAKDD